MPYQTVAYPEQPCPFSQILITPAQLHMSGALTDDEFSAAKARLLGQSHSNP